MNMPKKIWVDPLFWHSVDGTYTDHGVEIQRTPYIRSDLVDELVEALEHIEEYWNRDPNTSAMSDALWHIIEVAQAALAKLEESHD